MQTIRGYLRQSRTFDGCLHSYLMSEEVKLFFVLKGEGKLAVRIIASMVRGKPLNVTLTSVPAKCFQLGVRGLYAAVFVFGQVVG